MKIKIIIGIILFTGIFCMDISAQKNILTLIEKCEKMDGVDMNVIRKRNKNTKKLEKVITTLTIKSNKSLVDKFIDAFKKDENDALQAIDEKKNGRMQPQFYRFEKVSFSFSSGRDGTATITAIENYTEGKKDKAQLQWNDFDSESFSFSLELDALNESGAFYFEKYEMN